MDSSRSSEKKKILHSTPKSNSSSKSIESRVNSKSVRSDGTNASRPVATPLRKDSSLYNLNETGESTQSLLSVLSHSSVDSLSTGTISSVNSSAKSSPDRNEKSHESSVSANRNSTKNNYFTKDGETPTPWEKWLIEKTRQEREKIQKEIQKNLVALKARKKEEEQNKEKRRHIEARVLEWLKEKERAEKKKKVLEQNKKRQEQKEKMVQKQKNTEKDKVKREEWLLQKNEKEKREKEKADQEKKDKALAERLRKEKAEECFKKWKQESRNRPRQPTGSLYGKGHTAEKIYPTPSFINPLPWMPVESPPNRTKKIFSTSKNRSGRKTTHNQPVVESPPLLFKDRSHQDKPWGRPR